MVLENHKKNWSAESRTSHEKEVSWCFREKDSLAGSGTFLLQESPVHLFEILAMGEEAISYKTKTALATSTVKCVLNANKCMVANLLGGQLLSVAQDSELLCGLVPCGRGVSFVTRRTRLK